MKLVRPTHKQPPNVVQFQCSMEMTKHDIKNYLEKIYDVKTVDIRTRIALGKTRRDPGKGYVIKDEDIKYAYAVLVSSFFYAVNYSFKIFYNVFVNLLQPKNETFEFPEIFPEEKKKSEEADRKSMEDAKKSLKTFLEKSSDKPGTPGWFSF